MAINENGNENKNFPPLFFSIKKGPHKGEQCFSMRGERGENKKLLNYISKKPKNWRIGERGGGEKFPVHHLLFPQQLHH